MLAISSLPTKTDNLNMRTVKMLIQSQAREDIDHQIIHNQAFNKNKAQGNH